MAEKMKCIYDCDLWPEDLDRIIESLPELKSLSGKSVLITGAGGLICSSAADVLLRYNETHNGKIHVIAAGRSREKIRKRFGKFFESEFFTFSEYDASHYDPVRIQADYIIHGAGNAYPASFMSEPVETMMSNITGLKLLLDCAREYNTKRVLYISSCEIYGQRFSDSINPFTEDEYGYIDILSMRNCYSVSKRAAETLCAGYMKEHGTESIIIRPGHIYGPTASENDNRVASAFAYLAAKGENIIMKSEGSQLRSWCYCPDCASAILTAMLRGESVNAYNIPGDILSIREMSEMLAKFGGVELIREGASDDERRTFNPMNNSSIDGSKLESLGWKNIFDARTGFKHTVEILRDMIQ